MSHPENRFIQTIHRRLQPDKKAKLLYFAKVQVAGNNGWPDCYYSGRAGDLWIEYKWVSAQKFPKGGASKVSINLSQNQRIWLGGRHSEGRSVSVIVGSPHGHVILRHPFPESISVDDFMRSAVDTADVITYIRALTLEETQKDLQNGDQNHH